MAHLKSRELRVSSGCDWREVERRLRAETAAEFGTPPGRFRLAFSLAYLMLAFIGKLLIFASTTPVYNIASIKNRLFTFRQALRASSLGAR
jgi:hypothetical protein